MNGFCEIVSLNRENSKLEKSLYCDSTRKTIYDETFMPTTN